MRTASIAFLSGAAMVLAAAGAQAQPASVTYQNGLLSIQCVDAPLTSVFEQIEEHAGIELTLEDEVKSKKLTASLTDVPVAMAVQRLLEGVGVNYVVMMDPYDWGRVGKIFVGAGGGGPARGAGPIAPPVMEEPVDEVYDEMPPEIPEGLEGLIEGDPAIDPGLEAPPDDMGQNPEDFGTGEDPGMFPPGSSPVPEFLPPQQSFPRSNFTPGLPGNQRQQTPTQPGVQPGMPGVQGVPEGFDPSQQDPNAPPAMFPFTDPFGRPIPIPPGMNPPQQQQQPGTQPNRRNQQRQQQE